MHSEEVVRHSQHTATRRENKRIRPAVNIDAGLYALLWDP